MRLVLPLLAGIVVGAALRALWPLTDRLIEAAEKPSRAAGIDVRPTSGSHNAAPVASPSIGSSQAPAIDAILRDLDLVPLKPGERAEPSWLYVTPSLATLMRSDAFVEASITATEASVDEQCASLFAQLKLPRDREDQLRHLLAEMVFARGEITALAELERKKPTPKPVDEMLATSDERYRQRVSDLLGPEAFSRLESYFDTLPARAELREAFLRVAALASPLTPAQRDVLVAARSATARGGTPAVDPAAILNPAQLSMFNQWQLDEIAQRKVGELLGYHTSRAVNPIYTRPTHR